MGPGIWFHHLTTRSFTYCLPCATGQASRRRERRYPVSHKTGSGERRQPHDNLSCERLQTVAWNRMDSPAGFGMGNYNIRPTRATWRGRSLPDETIAYWEQWVKRVSLKGLVMGFRITAWDRYLHESCRNTDDSHADPPRNVTMEMRGPITQQDSSGAYRMDVVVCNDSLGMVSGASYTNNKDKNMFNLQIMDGGKSAITTKQSRMGTSIGFCSKQEFKARHPEMSCSELKKAYNAMIRNNGDKLRAALSAHMHEHKYIPKSVRNFKNGNMNVSLLHPQNLKDTVGKGKKTVTTDQVKESLKNFTQADLQTMLSEIKSLLPA